MAEEIRDQIVGCLDTLLESKSMTILKRTEKEHWVNGYQVRGGGISKTVTFNIGRLGVMISLFEMKPSIGLYRLVD